MLKAVPALLVVCAFASGCATITESRLNPINWFGRSVSTPVATETGANPLIPERRASLFRARQPQAYQGTLIEDISSLAVERRPGGAVITATGVASRQGPFEVRLIKNEDESTPGTLTYEMRRLQQAGAVGSQESRSVTAAIWLTDNELLGITAIRVKGARNIQNVRR